MTKIRMKDAENDFTLLTNIYFEEYPNTKSKIGHPTSVIRVNLWEGSLFVKEFLSIMNVINQRAYLEDAIKLLSKQGTARSAVHYEIVSPNLTRRVQLQVVNTQVYGPSPHGYLGHVVTYNKQGHEVRQFTLEGITLS